MKPIPPKEILRIDPLAATEKLRLVRAELKLQQEEFGSGLGVSKAAISRWETGAAEITNLAALAIEHVYRVNRTWLLEGVGPIWIENEPPQAGNATFLDRPLIVGAASCGPGGEINDPGPGASRYALRRDFAARILSRCGGGTEEDLFFLLCRGESMQPTIQDKEIVLVNTAMAIRTQPRNNGIYLVRKSPEADDTRVKRIRLDADRHQLLLGSDNRLFPQAAVDLDGIPLQQLILGRVVWVGRYLLDTDPPAEDW
jgi:DNA-binding XRE family transcriptional regulator